MKGPQKTLFIKKPYKSFQVYLIMLFKKSDQSEINSINCYMESISSIAANRYLKK